MGNRYIVKRDFSIDLLKSIAIIGVIIIHICSYNYEMFSFDRISSVFWASLVRGSVPIFFMCSGALFLNSEKPINMGRLFKKTILRIVVSMMTWAMIYKIFRLLSRNTMSLTNLFQSIQEVLLFKHESHFYYMHIILLVYLFLPIIRIITENATKTQFQYLLSLWFIFGIIYPTVTPFWPFNLLGGIPAQYKINMTYGAIGYGILGFYIKRYMNNKKNLFIIIGILGFLFIFGGTYYMSFIGNTLYTEFFEGMSIGVALLATGIFGFFIGILPPQNKKIQNGITNISKASFCIYLVHMFIIYVFNKIGLTANLIPVSIGIPVVANIIFICGIMVYYVLSKIPLVNKWII